MAVVSQAPRHASVKHIRKRSPAHFTRGINAGQSVFTNPQNALGSLLTSEDANARSEINTGRAAGVEEKQIRKISIRNCT
jgi:hypothetical protein